MFGVLAIYFTWFAPDPPVPVDEPVEEIAQPVPSTPDSLAITQGTPISLQNVPDSVVDAQNFEKYGALSFAISGERKSEVVETDDLRITFNSQGGVITEVEILNHLDQSGNPFKIMDASKSKISMVVDAGGKQVDLTELNFAGKIVSIQDTTKVIYSAEQGNVKIEHTYLIPQTGFSIEYELTTNGLNTILSPSDIDFQWIHSVNHVENTLDDSRLNTNVRYYLSNSESDELSQRSSDFEEATLDSPVKWVSFKQKFFTAAVIADRSFVSGYVNQRVNSDDTAVKDMSMTMTIPYGDFINGFGMRYYFGTNKYNTLKKVAPEFEENLDMGWGPLPIVNKFLIIPIFDFLQGFISNYGLIIVILVVFIRLLLSPLTYKSHMSMAKMRAMKPELDELKEKHEGDMQKQQQEQMKLYQQVGINPLSGCIPMLLQMPILFSLFFFFPNAVDLRGESFLWAKDLSTYDSIINLPFEIPFYGDHVSLFTLLMTLSTILYTWSNSQITTVQGPMKTLQYVMPIMLCFRINILLLCI